MDEHDGDELLRKENTRLSTQLPRSATIIGPARQLDVSVVVEYIAFPHVARISARQTELYDPKLT